MKSSEDCSVFKHAWTTGVVMFPSFSTFPTFCQVSLSLSSSLTNTHLSLSGLILKSTCSLCCQKLFSHPSQGGVTDWQWGGLTALNLKGVGGQGASGSTDICIYGRGDLSLTGGSSGGLY